MADQVLVEPVPEYTPLCEIVNVIKANQGAGPGRLLVSVEAYLEAGASEYVLETIRY